jgi:spermidine synthase
MPIALATACVLSGVAALVYQVLWSRQLALVLGTGTEAVAVVLSSFMAGLGLGSALAARFLSSGPGSPSPLHLRRVYAVLEGLIAGAAVLLPFAFGLVPAWLEPLYEPSPVAFRVARLALAASLLVLPTTAMGATLPVLVGLAHPPSAGAGRTAGWLYALNTVGAVLGALATPLLLLPSLGLARTGMAAAVANVAAALLVLGARDTSPKEPTARAAATVTAASPLSRNARLVLAVSFLSGLGALAHEVAWTRAMVLLVGPTVYAFAFVVAAVIAGLALGSALAGRLTSRLEQPVLALARVQAGIVAAALLVIPLVGRLPLVVGRATHALVGEPARLLATEALATFAILLVPAAFLGASFPFAVQVLGREGVPAGAAAGRVLAWNTLGALVGPLLAAYVLLPAFGLQSTLKMAAGVHVVAAVVAVIAVPSAAARRQPLLAVGLCATALVLLPRWDEVLLAGGAYRYGHREEPEELEESLRAGELLYYRDGAVSTVSVKRLGATKALAVDGKVDATNTADMATQKLIAHIPLLLHGHARDGLVVGLGSGATAASALTYPLEHLEVVEISKEVIEAARTHFAEVHHGVLDDARVTLRVTDARNHLQLTSRRFDVILSEPSNPWMAGVAGLFTREFFALVRARLRPGGLFGQWLHVYGLPVEDVRSVVGGFAEVFPESALFQITEGDLLLVGAAGRWPEPTPDEFAAVWARPEVAEDLRGAGLGEVGTLGTLFLLGPGRLEIFAGGAPRHTDDQPILELRAARAMLASTAAENRRALLDAAGGGAVEPWSTLSHAPSAETLLERGRMLERATSLSLALEHYGRALRQDARSAAAQKGLVRIATATDASTVVEGLLQRLAEGPDPQGARVSLALLYRGEGRIEAAGRELTAVLETDPSHVPALKLAAAIQGDLGQAGAVEVLAGRAFTLDPRDAEAAALLASASLLAGEPEKALERADAALHLEAGHEPALRVRALALARLDRKDEAGRAFAALLERDGGSWRSWTYYGAFLYDHGDVGAALRTFEQAAGLSPDSREAWEGLLRAAQALGDSSRVARAEKALRRLAAEPAS